MSDYDIIPAIAYRDLPSDPSEKFIKLVDVAQSNFDELMKYYEADNKASLIRDQFMVVVSHVADECNVQGLRSFNSDENGSYSRYLEFRNNLIGVIAKLRLRSASAVPPHTVKLERNTRLKIGQEIEKLRYVVKNSELPEKTKIRLYGKLDELQKELAKNRLSFAVTMAITASIVTTISGATSFLADAPKALEAMTYIIGLIGHDKEAEEAEQEEALRLAPPPKALPDLRGAPICESDPDEDIPF